MKPCPFCNSAGRVRESFPGDHYPYCAKDSCIASRVVSFLSSQGLFHSRIEAEAAWDTRAYEVEITQLRDTLHKIATSIPGEHHLDYIGWYNCEDCQKLIDIARDALLYNVLMP